MARLRIAPIVEGHGGVPCFRIFLDRLWYEEIRAGSVEILTPIRKSRTTLLTEDGLRKAVGIALETRRGDREANPEDETWIVAMAESFIASHDLFKPNETIPGDPEGNNLRTKWIEDRFVPKSQRDQTGDQPNTMGWDTMAWDSPTQDQAAMTKVMDLRRCREGSPSFARFWQEVEKRVDRHGREVSG